jgi:hypothetical protein
MDRGEVHQRPVAPVSDYCDRPLSVAYFVVSSGTAPWPLFTVVSVLTDVSLVTIVVSRFCLGVIAVSFACPTRSVCPELHPARLTTTSSAPASTNRISLLRVSAPLSRGWEAHHGSPGANSVPGERGCGDGPHGSAKVPVASTVRRSVARRGVTAHDVAISWHCGQRNTPTNRRAARSISLNRRVTSKNAQPGAVSSRGRI